MKVVKAVKTYRNAEEHKLIYIPDEYEDPDFEEDFVRAWAETEPGGSNYGYEVHWETVTDPEIIEQCLSGQLEKINSEIVSANKRRKELLKHLIETDRTKKFTCQFCKGDYPIDESGGFDKETENLICIHCRAECELEGQ